MSRRPVRSPPSGRTRPGDRSAASGAALAGFAVVLPGGASLFQGGATSPPDAMSATMSAMLSGMVILMIPAFFICLGVTILAVRKRRQWREREGRRPSAPAWERAGDAEDEPWR